MYQAVAKVDFTPTTAERNTLLKFHRDDDITITDFERGNPYFVAFLTENPAKRVRAMLRLVAACNALERSILSILEVVV